MRLSIILPVYNSAPFLPQCIESLRSSIDEETEFIVIDDGSTDGSDAIINDFCKNLPTATRFRQTNRGVSSARNIGLELARGQYISFVDSDDWVEPDIYREMMARMERTGAELAVTGFAFEPSGHVPCLAKWNIPNEIQGYSIDGIHRLIMSPFFGMLWNKMFRADIIQERHIRFEEEILYGEDGIFIMNYLDAVSRVTVDDSPMYHYRFRNNSLSHDPTIDRHPHHLESARIRNHYYQSWGLKERSTGWYYRSKILDIISKTVSTYHYGNPGRKQIRQNLAILRSNLHKRNLCRLCGWIIKSQRPWHDKIKLFLFHFHLDGFLYILHCVFSPRYRRDANRSVDRHDSHTENVVAAIYNGKSW